MRAALAVTTLCMALAVGCTGSSTTPSPVQSAEPTCPAGDKPATTPTQIVPTGPNLHGKITVLVRTSANRPTVVHAKVKWFGHERPEINSLRRSRIVLVRQVWETVSQAREAPPPINPDQVLDPSNVIASSRVLRTADLKDHLLTLRVPAGLPSRDYFLIGDQVSTALCTPGQTGYLRSLVGLVRVSGSS